MANYCFKTTGLPEPVDGVVEDCNFSQAYPYTPIYTGYSGLTFRRCNLCNCTVPSDSIIDDCGLAQMSWCSHVLPEFAAMGHIAECPTVCEHVVNTDTVTIDGVVVDTIYTYENGVR